MHSHLYTYAIQYTCKISVSHYIILVHYVSALSESVAKALLFYRDSEHKEDRVATEEFALLMDRFFDTFNVRDMTEGKKTRKSARDPSWKGSNWRFRVSIYVDVDVDEF